MNETKRMTENSDILKYKVGGVTWWRNNYGSILQAYALQEQLKSFDGIGYEIICQYGKKIASVGNFKDKLKKLGFLKTLKLIFGKFFFRGLRKRVAKLQNFVDERLSVSEIEFSNENIKEANNHYDAFICGSDQIWNPKLVSTDSIYWLNFANTEKVKIAYAPSIGVSEFSEEEAAAIKNNLFSFKAISCREQVGTDLLNSVIGYKKCETVLDPTLLINRSVWDNLSGERKIKESYIFVYLLRGNKAQRKWIKKYAKLKNLKIITIPFLEAEHKVAYDLKFGNKKVWDASPADFINFIRYADCVFTDSFHCTIFSCLYHRKFYIFPKIGNAQMSRLVDLQKTFGIESRIIGEEKTVQEVDAINEADWDNFEKILQERKLFSLKFLKSALAKD